MSLVKPVDAAPVHFPANPNAFGFDKEVSAIFNDMAKRSIPNFYEAHAAHAKMLRYWILKGASILDVGASRGAFFAALEKEYPEEFSEGLIKLHAVDNSVDMCSYLSNDYPNAHVSCTSVTNPEFLASTEKYDVVCAHYVLQFVPVERQKTVLRHLINCVKPGGVFIYGHKGKHFGLVGKLAHEMYIDFRLSNGYTLEEIEAKTKALKGSMFPLDNHDVNFELDMEFTEVMETFRFMMFNTIFAIK